MPDTERPSKKSARTRYFIALFAVFFTLGFVKLHFFNSWGVRVNLRENEPVGKSAAFALFFALLAAFFLTKKKFD
jgi:ABC-type Fe3+ transport system permease subunit